MVQPEREREFVDLLVRHRTCIVDSWRDRVLDLPDSHYAEQPPEILRQWGNDLLDALIARWESASPPSVDAHLRCLARIRRELGFGIAEVTHTILLVKEACLPFLLPEGSAPPPGHRELLELLDSTIREMAARFTDHYSRGARRTLEEERRRTETLLRTAEALSGHMDLDSVLRHLTEAIGGALDAADCAAYAWNAAAGVFRLRVPSRSGPSRRFRAELAGDHPLVRDAVAGQQPIARTLDELPARTLEEGGGANRLVTLLPVLTGSEASALVLAVMPPDRSWVPPQRTELAWGLTTAGAPAVSGALLHEETRRRLAESRSLQTVMARLLEKTGVEGMVEVAGRTARQLTAADGVAVVLGDHDAGARLAWSRGLEKGTEERLLKLLAPLPPAEPVVLRDLPTNGPGEEVAESFSSLLAVPLRCHGHEEGAILLIKREGEFGEEERRMCEQFACHAAVAIEHEQLHRRDGERVVLEERQKLARELHDSVTQSIYGVTMYAEAAARLLDRGDVESAASTLRELGDAAIEALREMRLLIFELRPPALSELCLADALESRLGAVEERAGLATAFERGDVGRLPGALEDGLYGIVREALNNTLKHSNAGRVAVRLRRDGDRLRLEIEDDGVGFDVEEGRRRGGLGLPGMKERAEKLGARLEVSSRVGEGTRVRVEVPLPWSNES